MTESLRVTHSAAERLRRFEQITDRVAGRFDLSELLEGLLDRVREVLGADTATVLLLDDSGSRLVASAARGLEEEVRQGVRVPVGTGFAGRIAATGRPMIVDQIDRTTVVNRILIEKGIRALLGVPLLFDQKVLGVLHVGSRTPRAFSDEDVDLLQHLADRVAVMIQTHLLEVEKATVVALQRSLVPDALPEIYGLEMAARYVPGEHTALGGDWYDVFGLQGGHVGIVIGDVAGRGLRAAVIMGRLRSALRAYALETTDPAEVITRLDEKLQHFEPYEMATVMYAVFTPSLDQLHVSSAGHPPPIIALPGEAAVPAAVPPDPPLGVPMTAPRQRTTIDIPPGAVLCFYTDGLIERRHQPIDPRIQLMCDVVSADEPERVCASVMFSLIGSAHAYDDVALLAVRRTPIKGRYHTVMPARPRSLEVIRAAARRWFAAQDIDRDQLNDMLVALGEASANAVEHAYGSREGTVEVNLDRIGDEIVMTISDVGHWREARGTNRGRGITVIERFSDAMSIDRADTGTTVTIRCAVNGSPQP